MRHRRKGRKLGRNPSHQRALLRNLASALFLTERDEDHPLFDKNLDPTAPNPPTVKGRLVTTLEKAKEVRPLVERCITIAKKSLPALDEADSYSTGAERHSEEWRRWRKSDSWKKWNAAIAPAIAARRRVLRLLGDKEAVDLLFTEVAPRFVDRSGGYTRIIRLATPRLGDAGTRAMLEFVGVRDRVVERSLRPAFDEGDADEEPVSRPIASEKASDDDVQAAGKSEDKS